MTTSKMILDRQKSSEKVQNAGTTHKTLIGKKMVEKYGNPELGPASDLIVESILNTLEGKTSEMVQADSTHSKETVQDSTARTEFVKERDLIRSEIISMRSLAGAVMGAGYLAELGFSGDTPRDGMALEGLAKKLIDNLRDVTPPKPLPGSSFEPQVWSTRIADRLELFRVARKSYDRELEESDATVIDKNKAIDEYDQCFSETASMISAFLRIAGETDLAQRVRPSTRRRGQTEESDDDLDE